MKRLLGQLISGIAGGSLVFGILYFQRPELVTVTNTTLAEPLTGQAQSVGAKSQQVRLVPTSNPMDIDFTVAAENTINAVVHVRTVYEQQYAQAVDPIFEFFFGGGTYRTPLPPREGAGSGVIISEDGYIVTNNHVIDGADEVQVTLNDGKKHQARLIGKDPTTDLALLKLDDVEQLPFVPYGNSDEVKVGQWVLALGNPFNLNSTVTAGIVSAKGRDINILSPDPYNGLSPIESFIQTDAAVNPGNSGGALINTTGELVGINTAIKSNTGSYAGYSFAVPVNIVRKVVSDLMEFGVVQRAFIGVSISPITEELAEDLKLNSLNGIYIGSVMEDGAAADAGIEEGDIIKKIGAVEVTNIPELQEQLSKFRPGDEVVVTVEREGKPKTFEITLRNRFGNTEVIRKERTELLSVLGASFREINEEEKEKLKLNAGLKVERLDAGKLRKSGIREGFIITEIDGKEIQSAQDLEEALADKKGGVLIEGIYPNGVKSYYGLGL